MVGKADEVIKWLLSQNREKLFEVKEYHQKRSLEMLKRYGQCEVISVLSDIDISRFVKYYEEIGKGHVEGKEFTHYRCYIGSSEYNSREMAILIDGIISEAEALGIETLPTTAIERMKALWNQS